MRQADTPARWRSLGAGVSLLGGEGVLMHLHPAAGEALAIADVAVPVAFALTLLTAILFGSSQTVERVFRLLRWIANRPEPHGPGTYPSTDHPAISDDSPAGQSSSVL